MKHAVIYLSFFLGAGVTVTFGLAYIGSPVTVPLGLLCLFTMWLIHRLAQEEPVTRLTEADHAPRCGVCNGCGRIEDMKGRIVECPYCDLFQEPATRLTEGDRPTIGDLVAKYERLVAELSPAPDQSGGAAGESATEPKGDTGAGEKL